MTSYRHPWDLVQYGCSVVYWLKVEGIPTIWTERALGATLPTGFSAESATLIVDQSSEIGSTIDPDAGLGTGLPLSFQLQDSTELSAYLTNPSRVTRLSADLLATTTSSMSVADASSFASAGTLYVGNECVNYTGTTSTSFTGLSRGVAGLAYAHAKDSAAGLVANVPSTDWRGRTVRLYAAPVDATGYVPSGTLEAISSEIWCGTVREGPYRTADATWQLDALSLDRKLAEPLAASISGTIDSKTIYYSVQAGEKIVCTLKYGSTTEQIVVIPYDSTATGPSGFTVVTGSELRAAIKTAWDAEVSALGASAHMGNLIWTQYVGKGWRGHMLPGATVPGSPTQHSVTIETGAYKYTYDVSLPSVSSSTALPWAFFDSPLHPNQNLAPYATDTAFSQGSVTVALEGVDPADVPSSGGLKLKGKLYSYSGASALGSSVRLYGVQPAPTEAELVALDGEDAVLIQFSSGSLADVLRRVIESSGSAALRGTYDTLPNEAGYSIPDGDVDEASFSSVVGGSVGGISFDLALSDRSLEDGLGGLLGLAERAVVLRDDGTGKQKLSLVRTSPSGTSSVATIADADLLVSEQTDPVSIDRGSPVPTSVEVELSNGLVEAPDKVIFRKDKGRRQQAGASTLTATIPLTDVSQATSYVGLWAAGRFSRPRPLSKMSLRVPPWVLGEPGDLVDLDLRHPSLYDFATGTTGFTGAARVLGRTLDLGSYQSVITVVPAQGAGLCPAVAVSAWAGTAAAPTTIDVDRDYYDHFSRTAELEAGGFKVIVYVPGQDSSSDGYWISTVTDTGSVCRLTVASIDGTPTLSTSGAGSWLTLPVTSESTAFQAGHAHTDSGGPWT
ncbi:MAG: hypothetical protein H6747_09575 [Deltaproteobacteria bacterium]|nr:hypothetical protein [Deltaproteobacteria bacterium]